VNRRGRRFERKESFSVFAQKDVKEHPGVRGGRRRRRRKRRRKRRRRIRM